MNSGDIAAVSRARSNSSSSSIWLDTSRPDFITTATMIAEGTSGVNEEAKVFDDDLSAQTELAVVLPTVSFNGTIEPARLADGMRCAMHDPVKCRVAMASAAAATTTGTDVSGLLGNGVCNPSANVLECGWDCGDCCRDSCLTQASRTVAGLDATNACPPGTDAYPRCVDPRFVPEVPPARLTSGVAPVCVACDERSLVCDAVNQTYPKPRNGFWVDPGNPFNILQCAEPSAMEACPAHTNVSDVLGGICGIDENRRVYMGEACAFCADGSRGTLRSFRARGKCKKCPEVLWLPYLTGAMAGSIAYNPPPQFGHPSNSSRTHLVIRPILHLLHTTFLKPHLTRLIYIYFFFHRSHLQ